MLTGTTKECTYFWNGTDAQRSVDSALIVQPLADFSAFKSFLLAQRYSLVILNSKAPSHTPFYLFFWPIKKHLEFLSVNYCLFYRVFFLFITFVTRNWLNLILFLLITKIHHISFVAFLCAFSSSRASFIWTGDHTCSRWGHTNAI